MVSNNSLPGLPTTASHPYHVRDRDTLKKDGSFLASTPFSTMAASASLGPRPGASSGLGRGRVHGGEVCVRAPATAARFRAQARGGAGGGGEAASKMEDEEVAESWEEAADSGVRRSRRPGSGPGGTWREGSLRGAGLGTFLPQDGPPTPVRGWRRGPWFLSAVKAS